MKRDPSLVTLSHDHQHALAVALELIRAEEPGLIAARDRMLRFMGDEGYRHFEVEERILLPFIADEIPPNDPDVERVLADHAEIRSRTEFLSKTDSPTMSQVTELGSLLQDHVRHEERGLFPRIEAALGRDRLLRLGALLEEADDRLE